MKVPFLNLQKEYQFIKKEIEKKFGETLNRGEYCFGQETEEFERNFAKLTGCKYCFALNSGTTSLMVALRALGIGNGDKVITTPFTFIATAEAIVNIGAQVVFADIDEETMNLDVNQVSKVIDEETKAILPVHLYGVPVELKAFLKVAKKHHLGLIEDAAHAEGSLYQGKPVGGFGDIGCFSFYPSKNLGAYGNAGAITTSDQLLANKIKMLSNHGRGQNKNIHEIIGYTGTIDNLQAAFLNIKLKYFKKRMEKKRNIVQKYNQAFAGLPIKTPKIPSGSNPSFYVYTIRTSKREKLKEFLSKQGIGVGVYYPQPLHLQPSLRSLGYKKGDFPNSEKAATSVLSLPLFSEMADKEVNYVIRKIKDFFI
jgi:dTDP-4-amino-4,6-dideoxygalactose transaminase